MIIENVKLKKIKSWNQPSKKFLFSSMILLGLLSLAAFILTSFWKYELLLAEFFGQGIKYTFIKYWTQFYLTSGNTQLIVVLFLLIMVLVESIFKRQIEKNSNGFFARCHWIVLLIYATVIVSWLSVNISAIIEYTWKDVGFGPGIDQWTLDSFKIKQTSRSIAFSLQTTALLLGSYYIHFKLINKAQFWKEEYWIGAIKGITFFLLSYIMVGFLKGALSRPYYFNYIFGDILKQLQTEGHSDWVAHYYEQTVHKYGFYNSVNGSWDQNIAYPIPWYKLNGFFEPVWDMPHFAGPTKYAFPSGHVIGTYCAGTLFFLFLRKNKKITWIVKLFLVIFLIHILSMTFALVVMRGHWVSDLAFSHVWGLSLLPTVNWLVNKIINKSYQKRTNKKEINKVSTL